MADSPNVIAVIVTYRRDELLRSCVDAVAGQSHPPDGVLVIDNDHLAKAVVADRPGVEIVETGDNLGPAGGYELGFAMAVERGADAIWTVDDDVRPDPACLERLLGELSRGDALIPLQRKPDRVRGHPPSWNGALFAADAVRAVGYPRGDLFFWAEDTEYFSRLRGAGYRIRPVPEAVVFHANPEDRPRGSTRDWRLYYEVRNALYVRLRLRRLSAKGVWRALRGTGGKLGAIVLLEPHKARSLRLWAMGVRDFLRGRLGKVVRPEDWAA
jgi:rhamnopyranosyl-N-acetylglucosaminyl-diphospho-decaprenol beta-1,3/1,4-galactofuranosyltransferase